MAKRKQGKLKEFAESVDDIGSAFGRNSAIFDTFNAKLQASQTSLSSLGSVLQRTNDISERQFDIIQDVMDAYGDMGAVVAKATKNLKKGVITQEEYNNAIKSSYGRLKSLEEQLDDTTSSGKSLKNVVGGMTREMKSMASGAQRSSKFLGVFNTGLDTITSHVPELNNASDVLKSVVNKDWKGAAAGSFALGAAIGAMAYNLGIFGDKVGIVAKWDAKLAGLEGLKSVGEQAVALGRGAKDFKNFITEKAVTQFAFGLETAAAGFIAAAKTARMGEQMSTAVGFNIGQLAHAGVGAETIANAMTTISRDMGTLPTAEFAANMALIEKRTGVATQDISTLARGLQLSDKVSANVSMNLIEGTRALAKSANVDLNTVMQEAANATRDMYSFNIKSSKELIRQAASLTTMGVSFGTIAKAGQSMVLNYKDSIKSEMRLSSMIGEQVDLSEIRSKFAAGDIEGAARAFKATGLDVEHMDMFAQQELMQAMGGLDTFSLKQLASATPKDIAALKQSNAGGANANFLQRTVEAQRQLEITNANINATGNIAMTILDTQQQQQFQDAIQKNILGLKELSQQLSQAEAWKSFYTGLGAIPSAIVGGLTTLFSFGALKSIFGGGAGMMGGLKSIGSKIFGMGSEALSATTKAAPKILSGGSKVLSKAGPWVAAAMATYGGVQGYRHADENLGKPADSLTMGSKFASGTAGALENLTFGLLNEKETAKNLDTTLKYGMGGTLGAGANGGGALLQGIYDLLNYFESSDKVRNNVINVQLDGKTIATAVYKEEANSTGNTNSPKNQQTYGK
jgi:hypothetical protein